MQRAYIDQTCPENCQLDKEWCIDEPVFACVST